ncbi:GntR family transcriptional regulator [Aliiroseovarius subalbicans]|uniref:GntR family transcriptional regulator n=1 Tax=Aliiroseovarius subalbicans TaxID=2925840 RepID=UPI001F599D50|nr:GntR family transcriptional regulator [Aliiroseovarius subalbicans]MCI2399155.1 GntR family transcriptional regulator [Aliiroseovarius subalbicans]
MQVKTAKLPDHEKVYRRLREMILFGELTPGQAVTIQGLVDTLGVGMTPVREAIRRLTSEGALVFQGNRRVTVPVLDVSEWDEIAFARLAVEPEVSRRAVENMAPDDITRLVAMDDQLNAAIDRGDVRGYLEHNYRFHAALYELSGAQVLLSIANMLWLRGGPSLRVVLGRYGTANLPDKHAEALAGMRAGDGDAVAEAIRGDILQGIDQVRASLLGEKV